MNEPRRSPGCFLLVVAVTAVAFSMPEPAGAQAQGPRPFLGGALTAGF